MSAVDHVLRYIKRTVDLSIEYEAVQNLHGNSDSSYASDLDDRKSIEGYVFFLTAARLLGNHENNTCLQQNANMRLFLMLPVKLFVFVNFFQKSNSYPLLHRRRSFATIKAPASYRMMAMYSDTMSPRA